MANEARSLNVGAAFTLAALVVSACAGQDNKFATVLESAGANHFVDGSRTVPITGQKQRVPLSAKVMVEPGGHVLLYSEGLNDTIWVRRSTPEPLSRVFEPRTRSSLWNLMQMFCTFTWGAPYPLGDEIAAKRKGDEEVREVPMLTPEDGDLVVPDDGGVRFTWMKDRREHYRFVLIDDTLSMHVVVDTLLMDTTLFLSDARLNLGGDRSYVWTIPRKDARQAQWHGFQVANADMVATLEREADMAVQQHGLSGREEALYRMLFWKERRFGTAAMQYYNLLPTAP